MIKKDCPYFGKCGGCEYLDIDYQAELTKKRNAVGEELAKMGINAKVNDTVSMFYPYEYRNKLHLAISSKKGKLSVGFFEPGTKKIIDIDSCQLFDDWSKKLVEIIKKWIEDFKIEPYNNETKSGTIRYVVARIFKNNLMITLVVANQNFAGKDELYKRLKNDFNEVSFWLNINNRTDSAVFDKVFIFKYGTEKLNATLCGIHFSLSPNSFMQTNYEMTSKIYNSVLDNISNSSCNAVVDLYSGIGITSCLFAKRGLDVLSVEVERSSVLDAKKIAKQNMMFQKIISLCGKCENLTDDILQFCKDKQICVFVDPARNGIEQNVLETILQIAPKKIIYMSCNPTTLASDLSKLLDGKKYHLDSVTPFDMFPKTRHIEVLAVLSPKVNI